MIDARIQPYRGAPAIWVNGKPTDSTMLFARLHFSGFEIEPDAEDLFFREQKKAADAGVHILTFFLYLENEDDPNPNAVMLGKMRKMVEVDPDVLLLPRTLIPYDHNFVHMPESENERFTDGKYASGENYIRSDFISRVWQEKAFRMIRCFIRQILADPILSEHVIGYHYSGGETGEWFQRRYWDGVLNISDANSRGFRNWLEQKYGRPFPDTVVPADLPGVSHEPVEQAFLTEPLHTDYLDYFSDEIVDMLERAARMIKEETGGHSLFVSFYGYHLEIPGSYSGHFSLHRLLQCPDVDILTSPVSYRNRNEGGLGAYMSEIGSVIAAGKLWLDESDYRMPVETRKPPKPDFIPYISSMEGAREVILREYGKLALHGAGTWWMDLMRYGWWDSDEEWRFVNEGQRAYEKMREAANSTQTDIIFFNDEKAMSMVGDSWNFSLELLGMTRDETYFAGVSYDFRLLDDFLEGKTAGTKLYVFLNPFRLIRDGRAEKVRTKLAESGAAALWCFGFPVGEDTDALRGLTGFDFDIRDTASDSVTVDGKTYARTAVRPTCVPKNVKAMGQYPDGSTAFAKTDAAGYPSYFYGGTRVFKELLRKVAADAGLSLPAEAGDNFNRIGNLAVLHTAAAGEKRIHFEGTKAIEEVRSGIVTPGGTVTLNARAGQTYLFILR